MKKIKFLAFLAVVALCFSFLALRATSPNNAYAAETSNEVEIKVDELTSQNTIFTDSTKKYVVTGTSEGKTITFVNDSLVEKTFYITISNLYISSSENHPVISIQDIGIKTTVHFKIQGVSEMLGDIKGVIHLGKYYKPNVEIEGNPEIVIDFSTSDHGTIELTAEDGTRKSQTIFVDENVDASISLCEHNTKLTSFTVNGSGLDTFDEGIAEATKDASKSKCKINLEKADTVQNKIEFNMMGHGSQVESVLLPEAQTKYTPEKVEDVDGLAFYGWYKDITLNHKWNPKTDTVTEDMTLYAGWFVPAEDESAGNNFPIWAIVLISVSAFVILLGNAYVLVYFCAYKKGRLNNKFFNAIYKPFKSSNNSKTQKTEKEDVQVSSKKDGTKNTSKKESLNKNNKKNDSKNTQNPNSKNKTKK